MNIEKLDSEIEKAFHSSGAKQGYDILQNDYQTYKKEKSQEFQNLWKHLNPLRNESHSQEITIPSDSSIKDSCFLEIDDIILIGSVSKNSIFLFSSINSKEIVQLSEHTIEFDIKDNPCQYSKYPKSKQKIVNFVRQYRQSVFPNTIEDLYTCDFFDCYTENQVYSGIVAGGSTGFIHFVSIITESTQTFQPICFQVHGDIIFDIKSLNHEQSCYQYENIVVSGGKDGCIFMSNILNQEKLVQFKDFLSTSPMSQYTSFDIDLRGDKILSACGDGTLQVWNITDAVKKILLFKGHINDFIKVEKAQYNYQIQAQEDIMHTVQVIQCSFYGKLLVYLTSQGFINLGTFIEPSFYRNSYKMRKFEQDNTGKVLNFFSIANYDLEEKMTNYNRIMFVDQKRGIIWVGKNKTIYCFDLKERQFTDINYNYSKPLLKFDLTIDSNIQKIFFNENYTLLFILTEDKKFIKYSFV